MILNRDKDKFEALAAQYIEWDKLKRSRQQSIFEQMSEIAAKEDIAQALGVDRKTLYKRHVWKRK